MTVPSDGRRWITLPLESNVRELDAKVLLAAVAAERGLGAVLLRVADFGRVVPRLGPSSVLLKDVVGTGLIDLARQCGHVPVALDEEGLVQRDPQDYLHRRVCVPAVESCARFLCWGRAHRSVVLSKVPSVHDRAVAVGNPRMDLLRPHLREVYRPQADLLRQRYGSFIMVNSNFGTANHRLGPDYVRRHWAAGGWSSGPGREGMLDRIVAFQARLLEEFAALIEQLAASLGDDCRVVLRPHPSEDHESWRRRLAGLPTVSVVHEGPVLPWLLASRALVHNGCTTGIEATLLDRPSFAFMPVRDESVESWLPNAVSTRVASRDELVKALLDLPPGAGAAPDAEAAATLDEHISQLTGRLSSEAVVDELERVAPAGGGAPPRTLPLHVRGGRASVRARSYASAARSGTVGAQRRYDALLRQTSPSLELENVRRVLGRLQQATGRFAHVDSARLAPDVLAVWSSR